MKTIPVYRMDGSDSQISSTKGRPDSEETLLGKSGTYRLPLSRVCAASS
jgi:hypothetical protein